MSSETTQREIVEKALAVRRALGILESTEHLNLSLDARDVISDLLSELHRLREAQARASRLEDAAFHFQTCRTCKGMGEDACQSGRVFAAFLRGEPDGD